MRQVNILLFLFLLSIVGLTGCVQVNNGPMDYGHVYGVIEVSAGMPVPTIEIEIAEDAGSGWNLHLITENITFAPERASTEHYPGEGHAHLHIDGKLIARLYGKWYHIPSLSAGQHQITVTLNSNDHNAYALNGTVISATKVILVEKRSEDSQESSDAGGGYYGK